MWVEQRSWTAQEGWSQAHGKFPDAVQLVLIFGSRPVLSDPKRLAEVKAFHPKAHLFGCSTSGEIRGTHLQEESLVATAVAFARTSIQGASVDVQACGSSRACGEQLGDRLPKDNLIHVCVLSDGVNVNGSELVQGLLARLPSGVQVTGGLAGDGERFQQTLVFFDESPQPGRVAAVGFYGKHLRVGYGSLGGWDPFGPERLITRSTGNVLYELDGQPALALYKKYLGEHAAGLPATGLLFPLSIRTADGTSSLVRTILGVDEAKQSMTFAGDIPQGGRARLMKANFDRLVEGASGAAKTSHEALGPIPPDLGLLISCVGRKLVLKQRTEDELEAVQEVLGPKTTLAGFYSYGEICPSAPNANCELHNQTMTITTLSEADA